MEIAGKITKVLDHQTGEGKNGTWKKQEYILQTEGEYSKYICFAMWNDKITDIKVGNNITAMIEIESREFNNKWYTNVQAWKLSNEGGVATKDDSTDILDTIKEDDLPF